MTVRSRAVLTLLVAIVFFSNTTGFIVTTEPLLNYISSNTPTPAPTLEDISASSLADSGSSSPCDESESSSGTEIDAASASDEEWSGSASTISTALTIASTYRNWVGPPRVASAMDYACYREAHVMDVCPSNFDRHEATNTCWTECPMDHPVECGMECIQQNDDCALEVIGKISVVASVAVKSVSVGVFGKFADMAKGVKHAVYCAMSLLTVTRALIRYVRNIKTSDPEASFDKIMAVLYRTNSVVVDLPVAILSCWGKTVSEKVFFAGKVLATTQFILRQVMSFDDELVLSWEKFKAFMKRANFTEPASEITEGEIGSLEDAMTSNSTCAFDLKSLTDRTWSTIIDLRTENPGITEDELRIRIQDTQLVKTDIATVTNNCMPQLIAESDENTAYKTRATLRKTFGVIVKDLIEKGRSDNGSHLAAEETAFYAIDRGFTAITVTGMDFMGLSSMIGEYLQAICGPTQFIGEIDDGTDPATLGLTVIQDAFSGSSLSWTKQGDGVVIFHFKSTDTEDVTVNIMSGGDKVAEVDVCAGGSATWVSNVAFLGGKTLYLDRWRPGVFGLPGTGGGSLLLWVPRASEGGHLDLDVRLNVS